ncbi:MAG: ribose-phosphate pyrophosphokinase [Desulfobacterales bacterium]
MKRHIIVGKSNPDLGRRIAAALDQSPADRMIRTFPDGEVYVRIEEDLYQSDVYVVQGTGPPVAENLMTLMLIGDACRRAGAWRVTAVVPYFGYARQDRRVTDGEPVGARMVADMITERYHRIITVDLHNPAIEGFFTISVHHLSALPLLAELLRASVPREAVVVAPDLGAAKLAQRYADLLDLPMAYVNKLRIGGDHVEALHLTGSVQHRVPVIVDDMISTGGTMAAAMEILLSYGCADAFYVSATHGLFSGNALEKLGSFSIKKLIVTDSIASDSAKKNVETISLGDVIAGRIDSITGK